MYRLTALVALAGFTLACGEEEQLPQTSATPSVSSSPADATITAAAEATQTPVATAEPTPPVGGKAPDGCLSTERAYIDPDGRFAFCYPIGMEEVVTESGGVSDGGVVVRHPFQENRPGTGNRLVATIGWVPEKSGVDGGACTESELLVKNERTVDLVISGRTVQACLQDRYDPLQPTVLLQKATRTEVPASGGGYISILILYTGPDFSRDGISLEEMSSRILNSTVVY